MNIHQQFENDGFVGRVEVLAPSEAQEARRMFDQIESTVDESARSMGLLHLHLQHQGVWSLATHPHLLDAVCKVIGPDVILMGTHFFVKYPGQVEAYVAWHQDVTYWGFQPPTAVTAWLAIDDADIENGCMRVIPGSHRLGQLPHGTADRSGNLLSVNQSLDASLVNESGAINVVLQAGQMSLHDGLLIHGSNPNRSNRRRAGLTVRFTRPDVRHVGDAKQKHAWKPILVRGEDRFRYHEFMDPPFGFTVVR
jgi:ectoine hydroxylase-related dioxygenase (phytanoyl-CoA dioxygenase family)